MNEALITVDWFTVGATLINTLILFLILKHFLYQPVKKMLKAREEEVRATYDAADQDRAQAQELKQEYESLMATAKEQAGELIRSATLTALCHASEIHSDAQKKAEDRLQRAGEQIETERRKAVSEARDAIAGLAISAAEQVVREELNAARNEKLVNQFLDQLELPETPDLSAKR